ncbi:MAG TPA: hypothetical protein VH762_08050 [Gemmatimonadaceae bacterium]|jgi:hypothetical protein
MIESRLKVRSAWLRPSRIALIVAIALPAWIALDLLMPRRSDFRQFDPVATGRLDSDMWRSYYERKPAKLFWQLARSLRVQFHAGFWESFPIAYRAAKAAFTFKDGGSRDDYARALPDLERYFAAINSLSVTPFNAKTAARDELEWWIIRREPKLHTTADWERLIAGVAAEIYGIPAERLTDYARLRVEAMVLRDQRGSNISEQDWSEITSLLERSWSELAAAVRPQERTALLAPVPFYSRYAIAVRRLRA